MIPNGWEKKSLSQCAVKITSGGTPKVGRSDYYGGNIPFLKIDDITSSKNIYLYSAKTTITEKAIEETAARLYPAGTVLVTMYGTIGSVGITSKEMSANQAIAAFIDLQDTNPEFLAYLLTSEAPQLANKSGKTTQANISGTILKTHEVLFPPLEEQKQIASILSIVDEAIQATQAVLDQSHRVKHGLLQRHLTCGIDHKFFQKTIIGEIPDSWETRQIGELVKQVRDPVSVETENYYQEIGIRSHGKGIFHKAKKRGKELGNKQVFWVEPDCLILNIVFAWERAVAITSNQEKGMIASHRFPMYKPDKNCLLLPFMNLYFQSSKGTKALGSISPGGAGRNKTLSQKDFLKLPIPVPPLAEQSKIVDVNTQIEIYLEEKQKKLDNLQRIKSGLMQDLLTGRVRVRCLI